MKSIKELLDRLFWRGVDFSNPNADKISSASTITKEEQKQHLIDIAAAKGFIGGYNHSQETHPYSDDDVVEFNEWLSSLLFVKDGNYLLVEKTTKELLQLWKEQKLKIK